MSNKPRKDILKPYIIKRECKSYQSFTEPMKRIAPELKRRIRESEEGKINIPIDEFKNMMGDEYKNQHPFTVHWGARCRLFNEGIFTHMHNGTLEMRNLRHSDTLPQSMLKKEAPKLTEEERKQREKRFLERMKKIKRLKKQI